MDYTNTAFQEDLQLFHQSTQIPFCVFDDTPKTILRYPLMEIMDCSYNTLIQCCSLLGHMHPYAHTPQLFASDTFYFALQKIDAHTNIMIGPVSAVPLTYKEFYERNKDDCHPDDLMHFYRIIQSSPHISIAQFVNNLCLFTKFIWGETVSIRDIFNNQLKIPKIDTSFSSNIADEPQYLSINDAISFQKKILYHIKNENLTEIETMFQGTNFFHYLEFAPSSIEEYYKIYYVYATLCCVLAIEEGMDVQKAFPIFDTYISKTHSITNPNDLLALCKDISLDYCRQIIRVHKAISDSPVITQCLKYIQNNLHQKITLDDLAAHCNFSKRTITRHFSEYYHVSVSEYILASKLKEAAFLLTNSSFSLSEISHQLAFSSQSHFTIAFKKKYMYTPQQYRDQKKN